jgi:hypothetical protein
LRRKITSETRCERVLLLLLAAGLGGFLLEKMGIPFLLDGILFLAACLVVFIPIILFLIFILSFFKRNDTR